MAKILIIDDEPGIRKLLSVILEQEGYTVNSACDGRDGLRKYRQDQADLVITDLIMPSSDGLEAIMALRRETPTLNIIAISGGGRVNADDYLEVAKKLGCRHTLAKPIDRREFIACVAECLAPADPAPTAKNTT